MSGTEWRYQRLGSTPSCNCAANSLCSGETACISSLSSGDRWAVASVSTQVCAGVGKSPNGVQSELGLGLGLGLGLPFVAGLMGAAYVFANKKDKAPARIAGSDIEQPQTHQEEQPQQGTTESLVFISQPTKNSGATGGLEEVPLAQDPVKGNVHSEWA